MAKAKKTGSGSGTPMVDNDLAAAAAARMLTARKTAAAGGHHETSLFKQMKKGLAKPHLAAIEGALDKSATPEQKMSTASLDALRQVGHNQTYSADVNRVNVPRRTAG